MSENIVSLIVAVASAIVSGALAFVSALTVLFIDRVLSARRERRDGIIERYDAERKALFVIKKWLSTACASLDRNISAAKNWVKIPTFSEKNGELVTTLSVDFLSEVKIIDLSATEVKNQTLQAAFLNIEQLLLESNEAAKNLSRYYERIVNLCYSGEQWMLENEALRDNTNRDLKRMAGDFVKNGMALMDRILEAICAVELYEGRLGKIEPKRERSVRGWDKFAAKKKRIALGVAEIQEKTEKFKEIVKKKPE